MNSWISVSFNPLLSLFQCFSCPKFGQWKPFKIVSVSAWYVSIISEIHAYFLAYDVPGLSYTFLPQPSFSHSSCDTPAKWPFHPYHMHAFFVLLGLTPNIKLSTRCGCPPYPIRAPTPHASLFSYVDIFLTLLKFWYPVWASLYLVRLQHHTPGCPPLQITSSPHSDSDTLHWLSSYMNALLTPCLVPQAGPSIHFIPLRFQCPVSDHHTSPWLAPTSHAGQSPHHVDTLLCRTSVDTYFRILGLPTTSYGYLPCLVLSKDF